MMRWTQTLLHRCQADPLKHSASDDDDDDVDGYDDPYHTLVYDPLKHDEHGHCDVDDHSHMDIDDYLDGPVMKHVVTEIMALSTLTRGDLGRRQSDDDDDGYDDH